MSYRDVESGYYSSMDSPLSLGLSSLSVRMGFVRKVYALLTLQLILTAAIAAPFVLMDHDKVESFIYRNVWLLWLSLAMGFVIMATFACFPRLMRDVPINYFLLTLFTVTEGVSVGIISSMYTTASVVMAFALVALVTFSLTLFATRTSYDVTKTFYPYLIAVTVAMVGAGLFLMLFPSHAGSMVYAAIGAVLFSVYIVFDTQMIVGGKSEMQYSVDDYVPATIALYIDIVSLFIYTLQLFGEQRRD